MFIKKRVWITLMILLFLVLVLCVIIIFFGGPNNFIDYFLELSIGRKRHTWVLLVAGSKGFDNYRHQADIAHAYQTLLNNGIPYDHIVVMMTNDVVNDTRNPIPGKLFNHPNGSDVYRGLRVDYSGKNVNSVNFLHILTGNKAAMQNLGSSRVIESNHEDNIFVNFVGHGTSGFIAFNDNYLYADELNNALQLMYEYRKFNKMLIYIEACKSGSLFDGILSETNNIFAVTAAGPRENSWSIYCFEVYNDTICLGDEFSVTWIEDIENAGSSHPAQLNELFNERTVLNQFNYIRTIVKTSNVMPYGDFSVGQDKLSAYIGKIPRRLLTNQNNIQSSMENNAKTMPGHNILKSAIKIYHLSELLNGKNYTSKQEIQVLNYYIMKQILDEVFYEILQGVKKLWPELIDDINELKQIPGNLPLNIFPCYRQTLDHITKNCFSLPKIIYSFDAVHVFSNLCKKVLNRSHFSYEEFDLKFKKVINGVCKKNSTFSKLQKIIDVN